MASSPASTPTLLNSPHFTPRFVPHRMIFKNDDDACYECIDRNSYNSVVVRLRKFETTNIETYKTNIRKAEKEAIVHPNLANLKEILLDEANHLSITVSENPRGITFLKFVETYFDQAGYDAALKQILTSICTLYRDLNQTHKDLTALPLLHVIISMGEGTKVQSVKIRRIFLSALMKRSILPPYTGFPTSFPSFVDLATVAFYGFSKQEFNLSVFGSLDQALAILKPTERTFIEKLLASRTYEQIIPVISDMPVKEEIETDSSDDSSYSMCSEDQHTDDIPSSEQASEYDIVEETATAVSKEDVDDTQTAIEAEDDVNTAIEDDDDETKTAIEDDSDEVKTAIGNEDDLETALGDEDETETAIEEDDTHTAVEEDDTQTAIEDDETRTAIEDDDDETKTAIEDLVVGGIYEVETAIDPEEDETRTALSSSSADFEDVETPVMADGFGVVIPHLAEVFKYDLKLQVTGATVVIEGNTIVYTRAFSTATYRKLIIYCDKGDVLKVEYELCYGKSNAQCKTAATYNRFFTMSPDAMVCFNEVYVAVINAADQTEFCFKNYGIEGLDIKFMLDDYIRCEYKNGVFVFNPSGEVFATSDSLNEMPVQAELEKYITELKSIVETLRVAPRNKFLAINFSEFTE